MGYKKQQITPFWGVILLTVVLIFLWLFSSCANKLQKKEAPQEGELPDAEETRILDSEYLQPSTVSYTGESGITYTLGCNELVELDEGFGIPLSPTSNATDRKIGFQIKPTDGGIFYSDEFNLQYVNKSDPFVNCFIIDDWTDNSLVNGLFRSKSKYGLATVISKETMERIQDGETDARILIRTVDLSNEAFMDAFYIRFGVNDEGKCFMRDAQSLDVSNGEYASYREEMCKTAIEELNNDGWNIASVTHADGTKEYSTLNNNPTIPAASRYVVEETDMTYSSYLLNRGEQGKLTTATRLKSDAYPVFAVTPCYDSSTAKQYGLYTIYLYPAFMYGAGSDNFTYLGYSEWSDPQCTVKGYKSN